jgi:NitT/TauT family transport system permease protein
MGTPRGVIAETGPDAAAVAVPEAEPTKRSGRGARTKRSALERLKLAGPPALTVVAILGIWEFVSRTEIVNPIVMPPPTEVADAFWSLVQQEFFWDAALVTVWETIAGLTIGVIGAWALGTLIGLVDVARRSLYPLVVAFQTLPRVALAPLFLVWFGFGLTPRIMFAITICFFPVLIAVIVGLQTVDRDASTLMRSFGASRWQVYRKLAFPSSLPIVFAGIKTAATLALIGAIVGEFVGGDRGLGVLLNSFNNQLQMGSAFATIVALAIFGLALYWAIELVDRKVVFWRDAG